MTEPIPHRTRPLQGLAVALLSGAITLLAVEVVLRAVSSERYAVWPSDLEISFESRPDITPGIEGTTTFSTNDVGIRGRSFSDQDGYRILAFGGSATECILLDDTEAWPHLLEGELNRAFPSAGVWVGNVGKSGHSARDHLLQVEKLPPQYPRVDAAIVLVGVNDLAGRLRRGEDWVPLAGASSEYLDDLLGHAFTHVPETDRPYPFYKRTKLWQTARRAAQRWSPPPEGPDQRHGPGYLVQVRERRAGGLKLSQLPDLTVALEDYRRTLDGIVTKLQEQDITPILMSQPALWQPDLPPEVESLLWFGNVRPKPGQASREFYTAAALDEAMRRYNEVLLSVCRQRGLGCIDLAASIPKDTTMLYDDVHFNEAGARRVAVQIAEALSRDPTVRERLSP